MAASSPRGPSPARRARPGGDRRSPRPPARASRARARSPGSRARKRPRSRCGRRPAIGGRPDLLPGPAELVLAWSAASEDGRPLRGPKPSPIRWVGTARSMSSRARPASVARAIRSGVVSRRPSAGRSSARQALFLIAVLAIRIQFRAELGGRGAIRTGLRTDPAGEARSDPNVGRRALAVLLQIPQVLLAGGDLFEA